MIYTQINTRKQSHTQTTPLHTHKHIRIGIKYELRSNTEIKYELGSNMNWDQK